MSDEKGPSPKPIATMVRLVLILSVIGSVLSGCSKVKIKPSDGQDGSKRPPGVSGSKTPSSPGSGPSSKTPSPGSSTGVGASPGTTPSDDPSAMKITVTPSARCVVAGQPMTIKIEALPKTGLSMVIGYSDSQPHGNYGFGDTDSSGTFLWVISVGADAPVGKATVLVAGKTADETKGGSGSAEFRVAKSC